MSGDLLEGLIRKGLPAINLKEAIVFELSEGKTAAFLGKVTSDGQTYRKDKLEISKVEGGYQVKFDETKNSAHILGTYDKQGKLLDVSCVSYDPASKGAANRPREELERILSARLWMASKFDELRQEVLSYKSLKLPDPYFPDRKLSEWIGPGKKEFFLQIQDTLPEEDWGIKNSDPPRFIESIQIGKPFKEIPLEKEMTADRRLTILGDLIASPGSSCTDILGINYSAQKQADGSFNFSAKLADYTMLAFDVDAGGSVATIKEGGILKAPDVWLKFAERAMRSKT